LNHNYPPADRKGSPHRQTRESCSVQAPLSFSLAGRIPSTPRTFRKEEGPFSLYGNHPHSTPSRKNTQKSSPHRWGVGQGNGNNGGATTTRQQLWHTATMAATRIRLQRSCGYSCGYGYLHTKKHRFIYVIYTKT
jgi:hypothetical protein